MPERRCASASGRAWHSVCGGALVLALTWACAAQAAAPRVAELPALPAPVREALQAAGVPQQAFAAVVLPLRPLPRPAPLPAAAGAAPSPAPLATVPSALPAPLWQFRAGMPMQPGSTMKLLTSIVALDRLGPNHRGFTELRSAAPVADGVLQGDLVLRGGADPELGVAQFWALLGELRAQGVHTIAGELLVDRTLFSPARADLGVPPFDDAPEFPYNVIPDALNLAGALLPLRMAADATQVNVQTVPPLPGIELASAMRLTERRCAGWDDDWQPATTEDTATGVRITLQGGFPRDCARRVALQLVDRQRLTEALFRALWAAHGGRFDGRARELREVAEVPAATRVLARRDSRPWGEVLRHMNKVSDNAESRLLYLSLGLGSGGGGGGGGGAGAIVGRGTGTGTGEPGGATTAERAAAVVRQWLAEQRIVAPGLVLDNGSGLSRQERITPLALAQALHQAWQGRFAPELLMSLPLVGVDGTMRNRLKDGTATGWARLKTGTLRDVAGLAGFVSDPQGRAYAVAMMINDPNSSKARAALDALVDNIARGGADSVLNQRAARPARPARGAPRRVGPQGEGP